MAVENKTAAISQVLQCVVVVVVEAAGAVGSGCVVLKVACRRGPAATGSIGVCCI